MRWCMGRCCGSRCSEDGPVDHEKTMMNVWSVLFILACLLFSGTYFTVHVTGIVTAVFLTLPVARVYQKGRPGWISDEPNTTACDISDSPTDAIFDPGSKGVVDLLEWFEIDRGTKVITGFVTILTFIFCCSVLVAITCRWKSTVQLAQRERISTKREREGRATKAVRIRRLPCVALKYFDYITGIRSPYFMWLQVGSEYSEFLFQTLAVYELSLSGGTRAQLSIYAGIILASILSSIAFYYASLDRVQAKGRQHVGRIVRRAILFDVLLDLCYSGLPLLFLGWDCITLFSVIPGKDGGGALRFFQISPTTTMAYVIACGMITPTAT